MASASLALLLAGLVPAAAHATPITLYASERPGAGFAPADVARAVAAGARAPAAVAAITDGAGFFTITLRDGAPSTKGKSKQKPARSRSTWTLHVAPQAPAERLRNVWLLVLGPDASAPRRYKTRNVGLAIDTGPPWRLVTPAPGGPTHLAYGLGDLAPGASYEIPIEHRVGQRLKRHRGAFVLPRYAIGYASVPEPRTWLLGLATTAVLLARRGLR